MTTVVPTSAPQPASRLTTLMQVAEKYTALPVVYTKSKPNPDDCYQLFVNAMTNSAGVSLTAAEIDSALIFFLTAFLTAIQPSSELSGDEINPFTINGKTVSFRSLLIPSSTARGNLTLRAFLRGFSELGSVLYNKMSESAKKRLDIPDWILDEHLSVSLARARRQEFIPGDKKVSREPPSSYTAGHQSDADDY